MSWVVYYILLHLRNAFHNNPLNLRNVFRKLQSHSHILLLFLQVLKIL